MWPNPQFLEDLVTFTEEFLSGKLHYVCSDTLLFSWPASHFLEHFHSCLSPFLTSFFRVPDVYLSQICLNWFFIIPMKFFTRNLSLPFKKCQNFQTKNKLKELVLAYQAFHKYHTSFNLVSELKLQWKSFSLLRGFSVSVQCWSSNSKNIWCNSFKSAVH